MRGTEKAAGPVTPQELEDAALRVAQATSTLQILTSTVTDADLHNALGLMGDYLDQCARDLSDLHRRHENQVGET
jgi:predicted phage gp36 major capsid-like protein